MLTKSEIIEIARFTRLKPYQQEKNYIQTIILNSIYSKLTDELVFKGGTALFIFSNLNRFSEDLDFTMIKSIQKQDILENIKKDLELLGIKNKISKKEDNDVSFSFRVDAEGPLFSRDIEKCYVKIEISKREEIDSSLAKEIRPIYPDIPGFNVCVMPEKEILAEKVRAILTRNQARDLFDLYFLLRKGARLDFELIDKKMSYYKKTFNKKEFIRKINELRDVWKAELEPFVIGEVPKFSETKKLALRFFM